MKKTICILLVLLMMLSVSSLQAFAAKSSETPTFEMLSGPARPFISGVDNKYKGYIWKYDETLQDWVNTGVWYYSAPLYGIEVKVTYGNGVTEIITKDEVPYYFVCRVYEEPAAGKVNVTLELNGDNFGLYPGFKITTFQMDVVEKYVDSMEVLSAPAAISYRGCNVITLEGMQIKINYTGGSSEVYEFGRVESDFGYMSARFHDDWIDVSWYEDGDFSGNSVPIKIQYLDCPITYDLPLYDSPYASIEIVNCDYELLDEESGIYTISNLTVKTTKEDGTSENVNCGPADFNFYSSDPDDPNFEDYCVIEGHRLKISCVSYSDSHQVLLAKYVNVSDSYELNDSRSQFEKFFDKIAIFFSEFLFKKLFYAIYWLF